MLTVHRVICSRSDIALLNKPLHTQLVPFAQLFFLDKISLCRNITRSVSPMPPNDRSTLALPCESLLNFAIACYSKVSPGDHCAPGPYNPIIKDALPTPTKESHGPSYNIPASLRGCLSIAILSLSLPFLITMRTTTTSLALAATLNALPTLSQSCNPIDNVKITFYGWDDNGPPVGPDNAFDCGRGKGPGGAPIAGGMFFLP